MKVEYKLVVNDPNLKNTYPYSLIVEVSNTCNLKCPLCSMGQKKVLPRENLMSLKNYKLLIEPLKNYLFQVFLYNWGEPFLNKDLYEIIGYNTAMNIGTVLSSNLNIFVDAEKLVKSGLEHLVISGDGISQQVYEKYRVSGKIDLVVDNLKRIIKVKRAARSKFPYIEWQCLVTKWNEFELDKIKKTALDLGVNEVRFCNINFYSAKNSTEAEKEWLPQNPLYRVFSSDSSPRRSKKRKPCFWLWRRSVINVNGGINPCCLYDVPDWENAFNEDFLSIWNNEKYVEARKLSLRNYKSKLPKLICNGCEEPYKM